MGISFPVSFFPISPLKADMKSVQHFYPLQGFCVVSDSEQVHNERLRILKARKDLGHHLAQLQSGR